MRKGVWDGVQNLRKTSRGGEAAKYRDGCIEMNCRRKLGSFSGWSECAAEELTFGVGCRLSVLSQLKVVQRRTRTESRVFSEECLEAFNQARCRLHELLI